MFSLVNFMFNRDKETINGNGGWDCGLPSILKDYDELICLFRNLLVYW